MNMKRLLCLALAMLVALSAMALAETGDDLQAQLDAANARVAELEAQVELYKPYYDKQVVAEFGEDGIIWLDDAMKEYEAAASAYAQYGLSIDDYADGIKEDILKTLVRDAVIDAKAAELGLSQLDDETVAKLQAEAAETFENYVDSYRSYFASEDATDEEARAQTLAALESYGLTQDALAQQTIDGYVDEQLYNLVTADVTVTDEEVQAKYDAMVAEAQESYSDDRNYNNARNNGDTIAWNPEGYRAVKHVLVKFDDDQAKQYSELHSTLDSLNAELEALDAPAETEAPAEESAAPAEGEEAPAEGEEAPAEGEEAPAEEAEATPEVTPEPTPEPRSREEIQSDIGNIATEIEALYSQLLPQAQQVIDEFDGSNFDSLIEKYNADPGMQNEPTATNGYAVSANSNTWDPAFTEGAMSIETVGQISGPVYGQNGIHVIYYLSDITPGPVALEDIADAVKDAALQDKTSETYDNQINAWVEEANPVYHVDRF
ncbi:MAG: peptidylprolyl isomerase [Clostridia bacterium]|nr:peptidylprolyl isomerase [Clostridia bacterium]